MSRSRSTRPSASKYADAKPTLVEPEQGIIDFDGNRRRPCAFCRVQTLPPHDARQHTSSVPFTEEQLAIRGYEVIWRDPDYPIGWYERLRRPKKSAEWFRLVSLDTPELGSPALADEAAADEWLGQRQWPNGPECPYCNSSECWVIETAKPIRQFRCRPMRKRFNIRTGSIFHGGHLPLHHALLAVVLLKEDRITVRDLADQIETSTKSVIQLQKRLRAVLADTRKDLKTWWHPNR